MVLESNRIEIIPAVGDQFEGVAANLYLGFVDQSSTESLVELSRGVRCQHAYDEGSMSGCCHAGGDFVQESAANSHPQSVGQDIDRKQLCVEAGLVLALLTAIGKTGNLAFNFRHQRER
jgi:hypothetical protein